VTDLRWLSTTEILLVALHTTQKNCLVFGELWNACETLHSNGKWYPKLERYGGFADDLKILAH
jgi:hypothetical protein